MSSLIHIWVLTFVHDIRFRVQEPGEIPEEETPVQGTIAGVMRLSRMLGLASRARQHQQTDNEYSDSDTDEE